jgi:hypothetical protein
MSPPITIYDRRTAINATIRAIRLSREAADRGNVKRARRAWGLACRLAWRCGGISGCDLGGKALLIQRDGRDYVAHAPTGV